MPRTITSGDDAVVGQTVPSTTLDLSKGTGTTRPASSSNNHDAGDSDSNAVIVRPPQKFCVRMLAVMRASS